jgi:hypothetical protein
MSPRELASDVDRIYLALNKGPVAGSCEQGYTIFRFHKRRGFSSLPEELLGITEFLDIVRRPVF